MIVVKDTDVLNEVDLVATIGFFDGVHLGHRFLISQMQKVAAKRGLQSAVITFPQHPRAVLQTDYQPKLLNSFEEKLDHLASTGIDYCIVLDFTPELAQYSAQEFISTLLAKRLHVKTLLIGYDHRFGHDRTDGFEQYVTYGKACGIEVLNASAYKEKLAEVSSSEIRRSLLHCDIEKANHLLTYPYQLKGHIVRGHEIGRKLGFPTANIQVDEIFKIIPGIGVYAAWVDIEDKRYKGMLYIGDRPTLNNGDNITLEVHILDFSKDIYNKELTVSFIQYVRGDIKFDNVDRLIEQLKRDRISVSNILSTE